ncbi:unnamed protein product [Linum tenue]|uniref:Uncharacterized protein n=1 Tax=Linum tenue TaxID=586396 RepID=A0AAV0J2Y1_9ROSI|nr:unnamed protein product [Linum tenue]
MNDLHGIFKRVELFGHRKPAGHQVTLQRRNVTIMNHPSLVQQHHTVDHGENLEPGLVYRQHHGPEPRARDPPQRLHDAKGRPRVEARGGLVEDQHSWVVQECQSDGDSPTLPAGESPRGEPGPRHVGEGEFLEEGGDGGGDGGSGGGGGEEAGGEGEGFGDGEEREEGVMLREVSGELAEGGGFGDRGGVEEEGAGGGGCPGGEDVEEGGLSGAGWADDGEDLGREGGEGDLVEYGGGGWLGGGGGRRFEEGEE